MIVNPLDNTCTEMIVGEQPRPSISAARVQNCANRLDQIFRQRHTNNDVLWELNNLMIEAGVTVEE